MNDQNHRVADATRYLITQIVPAFARELDAQADKLPISQPAECLSTPPRTERLRIKLTRYEGHLALRLKNDTLSSQHSHDS